MSVVRERKDALPQMARRRRVAQVAGLAAAVLLAAVATWFLFPRYPEAGVEGDFLITRGNKTVSAAVPERGDRIVAGSAGARVRLGGYCELTLDPSAEIVLRGEPRSEAVKLQTGSVRSKVTPGRGGFSMLTPTGSLRVIGTEFTTSVWQKYALPPEKARFGIYLVKEPEDIREVKETPLDELVLADEPLLTQDDIESYEWQSHTLRLKPGVKLVLPANRIPTTTGCVLVASGQRCYPAVLEVSSDTPLPTGPPGVTSRRELVLSPAEIRIHGGMGDARDESLGDKRIRQVLQELGKLKDAQPEHIPLLTPEERKRAEALIARFSAPEFAMRQKAVDDLVKMGPAVLSLVRQTHAETRDNEVKLRCRMVIRGLGAEVESSAPAGDKTQSGERAVAAPASTTVVDVAVLSGIVGFDFGGMTGQLAAGESRTFTTRPAQEAGVMGKNPGASADAFARKVADAFVAALQGQKLRFLDAKTVDLLGAELRDFVRGQSPRAPSEDLAAALAGSVDRYVPDYFHDDEETYLEFRDRVNTLKLKLHWALSERPSADDVRRRDAQRQWMRDYIAGCPENPVSLQAHRLQPGGLRAMALAELERWFADPLSPLHFGMDDEQFGNVQASVQKQQKTFEGSGTMSVEYMPAQFLYGAWGIRLPWHKDPADPGRVIYEVQLPFDDTVVGYDGSGLQMNVRFASQERFRGYDASMLAAISPEGMPSNALDVATGRLLNFWPESIARTPLDGPERKAWLAEKKGFDLGLDMSRTVIAGFRGAKLAKLDVSDWFAADRVSDAALRQLVAEKGGDGVSVVDFPLWPYGAKTPPPTFIAVVTAEGRLAVAGVTMRSVHPNDPMDGWVSLRVRLRPLDVRQKQ
jgi:hypothetical protein